VTLYDGFEDIFRLYERIRVLTVYLIIKILMFMILQVFEV